MKTPFLGFLCSSILNFLPNNKKYNENHSMKQKVISYYKQACKRLLKQYTNLLHSKDIHTKYI